MSETPRTDAYYFKIRNNIHGLETTISNAPDIDHARTLERENNQLRADLKQCAEALKGIDEMNDNYFSREELVCDRDRELYDMLHNALSLPSVQSALSNNGTRP